MAQCYIRAKTSYVRSPTHNLASFAGSPTSGTEMENMRLSGMASALGYTVSATELSETVIYKGLSFEKCLAIRPTHSPGISSGGQNGIHSRVRRTNVTCQENEAKRIVQYMKSLD